MAMCHQLTLFDSLDFYAKVNTIDKTLPIWCLACDYAVLITIMLSVTLFGNSAVGSLETNCYWLSIVVFSRPY